MNKTSDFSWCF